MKKHFPNSIAEIDLNLLRQNIKNIKKRSGSLKVLAVVKCNAYSHGSSQVARAVQQIADWYAVANVDEGIELRMNGVTKPILVYGVPRYDTAAAYQTHNLTATISDFTHFSTLMDGPSYHLNFDTGMGRLGFYPENCKEVRELAVANQRLICSGIYSHYASADDPGSNFVKLQQNRFKEILSHFPEVKLIHMSNTGAAVNYPDLDQFSMIRTGLGMLGYNSGRTKYEWLKPVLTWSCEIAQVRKVQKGMPVSYSSTWRAPEDGYLATLPVGYGDGVPRSVSNKLHVSIKGELYPQVGNVTMDMCMVYLGGNRFSAGTKVTLMGSDGWNASEWANCANTNIHEIVTNLTGRISKVYLGKSE